MKIAVMWDVMFILVDIGVYFRIDLMVLISNVEI
jgi:hypothetical protein